MSEPGAPPLPPPSAPPPPPPGGTPAPGNPWERRAEVGFLDGLVETVKLFVAAPTDAFARTRERGDYASPLLFGLILGVVGAVVGHLWGLLFGSAWMSMLPPEAAQHMGLWMTSSAAGILATILLSPIWVLVGLFLYAAILHVCVLVVGAGAGSSSGFEGTFRVVSYSCVAQLASVIPFVGGLVALVWGVVLAVMGVMRMHRASQGQALAAVLIPLLLCCVCILLGMAMAGFGIMAALSGQG